MRKILDKKTFTFTKNKNFEAVITNCKNIKRLEQEGESWITDEYLNTMLTFHKFGLAHSFEVWQNDQLVGGFYGVKIGRVFCGESMFSKISNASKAGFINFIECFLEDITLIDCQLHSHHLASLGAENIPKLSFLEKIAT